MIAQDQQSRVFYELSALLLSFLRPPPPLSVSVSTPSSLEPAPAPAPRRRPPEISPSGFASLLLGISLALMLCGSVTFVIGFILMPWVLGLAMIFYFVGLVSNLSGLGRAILLGNNPTGSERKKIPGPLLSKLPIL